MYLQDSALKEKLYVKINNQEIRGHISSSVPCYTDLCDLRIWSTFFNFCLNQHWLGVFQILFFLLKNYGKSWSPGLDNINPEVMPCIKSIHQAHQVLSQKQGFQDVAHCNFALGNKLHVRVSTCCTMNHCNKLLVFYSAVIHTVVLMLN